jgi:hypothetical protein
MASKKEIARIAELAELLVKYKDAYYNKHPLVSDAAYDNRYSVTPVVIGASPGTSAYQNIARNTQPGYQAKRVALSRCWWA